MSTEELAEFAEKMRVAGLPEIAIESFASAASFVRNGGETMVRESTLEPVSALPALDSLEDVLESGREAASKCVTLKLNGGLGTSMGLSKAKSLLPVRDDFSFLDLIARQVLAQRKKWQTEMPLVLMNSFRTRDDSLSALEAYPDLKGNLPLDFVQHKIPRIDLQTWKPVDWAEDEGLEWCPPGHGDLYIAIKSSGMLDRLLDSGIRWAFVSNADNLGAVLDLRILGWIASNEIPFLMEVAKRTPADRKGGHLARRDGQLLLREVAQCDASDLDAFQDIERHRYFNTNNLWIDLAALQNVLSNRPEGLPLPIIRNEKRVSSTNAASPRCLQLETAMGSAIECFPGSRALAVPRERFTPVKTTNDLLGLWSDAYQVTQDSRMVLADSQQQQSRLIDLDPQFFGKVDDLVRRFPHGAPSLAKCSSFRVSGDHLFGTDVVAIGEVELANETNEVAIVPDGTVLRGD